MRSCSPKRLWLALLLLSVAAGGAHAQWRIVAPNALTPFNPADEGGQGVLTFKDGILWAGFTDLSFSLDSGKTWSVTNLPTTPEISAISFWNADTGVVSDQVSGSYVTLDHGNTWSLSTVGFTEAFYSSRSNVYGISDGASGSGFGFYQSSDNGVTWNLLNSIAGIDFGVRNNGDIELLTILSSITSDANSSTDSGITWTTNGGQFVYDSYSIGLDSCDPSILYIVSENNFVPTQDSLSRLFRSSDRGATWQVTFSAPFGYLSGSFSVSGHAQYAGTTSDGILRSTDQGITWKNIGGPNNVVDCRCICAINDNMVFGLDSAGNVWETVNSGGDSIALPPFSSSNMFVVPSQPTVLAQSVCDASVDTSITIGLAGCGTPNGVLDSLWVTGSTVLQIADSTKVPRALSGNDSILIRYVGTHGPDTAQLHFRYDLGSGIHDTAIQLIGRSAFASASEPNLLHRESASAHVGHLDSLILGVDISAQINLDSLWPYLTDIQATYSWDSSVVSYNSYLPPVGWSVTSLLSRGNAVDIVIHNVSSTASTPLVLGTALFQPDQDQPATSWVELPRLTLDAGQNLSFCISEDEDNHWAVETLGLQSGVAVVPISTQTLSIYPNPAGMRDHADGNAWISSSFDLGTVTIEIYDMLGIQQSDITSQINENAPIELQLPKRSGVYNIVVRSSSGTRTLRVVREN